MHNYMTSNHALQKLGILQHQVMLITKVRQLYDTKLCILQKLGNCTIPNNEYYKS